MSEKEPGEGSTRVAACPCGALQVTVSGAPVLIHACSCLACQRRSGSAFTYSAFFPDEQVLAVAGDSRAWRRTGHSGGRHESHFCPVCGVAVYARLDAVPGMIAVAAGCFAEPDFMRPSRFYWTETRHRWLEPIVGVEDALRQ
ncbi:GFA family protein [Amphiplicatus metriothermophilus]|uniref:Uncharacterized conserved protein n=1 Tax=Amphiplicatus metriothermophilus TaxID=1519374 RepID=A0A239PZ49_9PROT|nr:GFA family protein [Amphiplicatus metriothermophilus]MBB5518235.1 hypothetical protein [Amphiplicatus metriothermophilus]SNT75440.1 Uncharacterized conserved protein [Amphiplicatus metriothermophilus]